MNALFCNPCGCSVHKALCKDYKYLKPDDYIEQTLEALANRETVFADLTINASAGRPMFKVLSDVRSAFLGR